MVLSFYLIADQEVILSGKQEAAVTRNLVSCQPVCLFLLEQTLPAATRRH
jgi:hypothetical protein